MNNSKATIVLTERTHALILAGLRHLQTDLDQDVYLEHLVGIVDISTVTNDEIEALCQDIKFPDAQMPESYRAVAISTSHLTEKDRDALEETAQDQEETMVMSREYGFFIKLYPDDSVLNYRYGHSDTIKDIIKWAVHSEYQMIEFDRDAGALEQFPEFEW